MAQVFNVCSPIGGDIMKFNENARDDAWLEEIDK